MEKEMEKYVLALDQGTTSSRAIVFDHQGNPNLLPVEGVAVFPGTVIVKLLTVIAGYNKHGSVKNPLLL